MQTIEQIADGIANSLTERLTEPQREMLRRIVFAALTMERLRCEAWVHRARLYPTDLRSLASQIKNGEEPPDQ